MVQVEEAPSEATIDACVHSKGGHGHVLCTINAVYAEPTWPSICSRP